MPREDTIQRCRCGKPAKYAADSRCEDCFVEGWLRVQPQFAGRYLAVNTAGFPIEMAKFTSETKARKLRRKRREMRGAKRETHSP